MTNIVPPKSKSTVAQINACDQELGVGFDLTETLRQTLYIAIQGVRVRDGSILVLNENGKPARWFYHREGDVDPVTLNAVQTLLDQGMLGWVIQEKRGEIIPDVAQDSRWLILVDFSYSIRKGSAICVPLLLAKRVVGVLTLTHPSANFFTLDHLSLLQNIADQAAMTVENARLYAVVRRWAQDMTALYESALNIAADQPLDHLLNTIITQAIDMLHCQGAGLFLWRERENVLELVAALDPKASLQGMRIPADEGLVGQALQMDKPLAVDVHELGDDSTSQILQFMSVPATSALAVPLVWHGRRVGVLLAFERTPGHRFDHITCRLATMLAHQTAAAIVSAELYTQTTRRLQELTFLHETTLSITSTMDLDQILNTLTSKVKDLLGIEACSVALVEPESGDLIFKVAAGGGSQTVVGQRVPTGKGIAGAAAQSARPINVPDVRQDQRFFADFDQQQTDFTSSSILAVPMISRGRVVGVVEGLNKPGGFDQEDERLLNALATLAASIVDNAALFERVQMAESRFQSLFEDAADAVWVTDLAGNIIQGNRKAELLTGHQPGQVAGMALANLSESKESPKFAKTLAQVAAGKEVTIESWVIDANKRSIPLELNVKCVHAAGLAHVQWIGRDISDRRELERLREDLTHMLIHDLRSPLGTVTNSLKMIQDLDQVGETDQMDLLVDIATRATTRMSHLIGSLLDIGRLEAGQPLTNMIPVSLQDLVDSAVELITPLSQYKRISLNVDLAPDLPIITVDASMIERVIVNLLDNGAKFTPSDGAVTISARVEIIDDIQVMCVDVRDTGPGIPFDVQRLIFDKFTRAQHIPQTSGVGLGLSFCRLAVEAHRGRIWVDSTPGEGATFTFCLPLKETTK